MRIAILIAAGVLAQVGHALSGPMDERAGPGFAGGSVAALAADEVSSELGSLADRPLAFVENRGQWDTPARFVAWRGAMTARLEESGIVLDLRQEVTHESIRGLVLRLGFEGVSRGVRLEGEGQQRAERNYFYGPDPGGWVTGVPAYSAVLYRGLYEGIDLRVRDHEGRLEYDLLLAPGADLDQVVFRAEGTTGLVVESGGTLRMETERGPVIQSAPHTWFELPSGEREEVECRFVPQGDERYGFELARQDPAHPLVIDPGLEWSTFFGGLNNEVLLAMDDQPTTGHVIVGGRTYSNDFPTTPGAYDETFQGGTEDCVVSCFDPTATGASQLVWSTYLGGALKRDRLMELVADDLGRVNMCGMTLSSDFPTTAPVGSPYQTTLGGGWDAFVARLSADGSALEYSTFLGGTVLDVGIDLVHLGGDTVAVTGSTTSTDFPTSTGCYQPALVAFRDIFVCVLDLAGGGAADLQYSTYLGGNDDEGPNFDNDFPGNMRGNHIAVGVGGELVLAGWTYSTDFPTTANAYQGSPAGEWDAFVARLDPAGGGASDLQYSTYIGGTSHDGIASVVVEPDDDIVVGGWSYSDDFPTTAGSLAPSYHGPAGSNDAYLLWLDTSATPSSQQVTYSTYLPGDGWESTLGLVLDGAGGVIASGFTGGAGITSTVFPVTCGCWQPEFKGGQDCFLLQLTPASTGAGDLLYSTLVGGALYEGFNALTLASAGSPPSVFAAGRTNSFTDFPTTPGAYLENPVGGLADGIIVAMELGQGPFTYCSTAPNSVGPGALIGSQGTLSITDNTFTVTVSGATPSQFGFFYYGKGQIQLPFGDGFRCVSAAGSGIHRLNPAQKTDASGYLQRLVDFTQPPAGSGTGQIDPGTTWNFQFWYRDPGGPGGTDFNLSDALRGTFCP